MSTIVVLTTDTKTVGETSLRQAFASAMVALLYDISADTLNKLPLGYLYSYKKSWKFVISDQGSLREFAVPANTVRLAQALSSNLPDCVLCVYPRDLSRIKLALKKTAHNVTYYSATSHGKVVKAPN